MRYIYPILLLFISLTYTCAPATKFNKTKWLIGTWENRAPKGSVFETWTQKNSFELVGRSYTIAGKDTITLETVRITMDGKQLLYIPTVNNQNDKKPIPFSMKSLSKNEMIFENLNHDFPNIIAYQRINNDSLIAYINGKDNREATKRIFPMKKVN